jgi:EAL domain-containing protein (putative c-di-GMP-specific phosphodiesterase class I)/FixJ family two-component response regulator
MSQAKQTVLIVDDEINILKSMRRMFKQAGYEVFTAESGLEGLALLADESIQVILSDFRMPVMNGGEFLAQVKINRPDVVSLILSGYADFDSVLAVMNQGSAFKFLTKPWDNQVLLQEIANAFVHYETKLRQDTSLEQSKYFDNINEFNGAVESFVYENIPFSIGYFELSNANDLKRYDVVLEPLLSQLQQYISTHWGKQFSLYSISDVAVIILTHGCHEQNVQIDFSRLVSGIEQDSWHQIEDNKVDVSVSFISSDDLDKTTSFIVETLQEAAVLINTSSEFMALNNQYLLKKQRQLTIKSDVPRALKMNQFSLVYQPKITMKTGLIEGAEVLLRWRHDSLGWVSPGEFIDIVEADGQINDIGDWVIDNGLAELSRLSRISHELHSFSINVSASQLLNIKLVQTIQDALHKYNIDPRKLEIEVTETSLIKNLNATSKTLNALKSLGIKIAIDDFGVGYSSFAYLTKLPIDVLKLDRALLEDIEYNQDTQLLINNLVKTCHNLNIKVVAEGIETKAALEKINIANCDYVQGYYYSAAVSKNEIEKLFIKQPFRIRNTGLE